MMQSVQRARGVAFQTIYRARLESTKLQLRIAAWSMVTASIFQQVVVEGEGTLVEMQSQIAFFEDFVRYYCTPYGQL